MLIYLELVLLCLCTLCILEVLGHLNCLLTSWLLVRVGRRINLLHLDILVIIFLGWLVSLNKHANTILLFLFFKLVG